MRKSGILMHISSLPSPYGIGTLGKSAYDFADFLAEASQHYWQVLPLSPTGYGDSPYQSFSSFAGNPYFIDLDLLEEDGLLLKDEYAKEFWGDDPLKADFGLLYHKRYPILYKACDRLLEKNLEEFHIFCNQNAFWLNDYALFMALKDENKGAPWYSWSPELRGRDYEALRQAEERLSKEISRVKALQFLFFKQWTALRRYCREKNIEFIGDIPIYVAPDSADVWSAPQFFMLDENYLPVKVAGCPPDPFTEDGQLWGNPLYDWKVMADTGYSWWIRRVAHQFEIYDVLRIDHFRGFDTFYTVPYGEKTARNGEWVKGPGLDLFNAIHNSIGRRRYIAEDLGFLTDSVRKLVKDSGFPGMKLLQFGFDPESDSDYLPHHYIQNTIAYTGTHDNETCLGWIETLSDEELDKVKHYLRCEDEKNIPEAMLAALWACVSDTAIATMQDLLGLGKEGRMNTPGMLGGNWQWRMSAHADLNKIAEKLYDMTKLYGRL